MANDLIVQYGAWMFMIVVLGSMVDLFQAMWIAKRMYKKWKRSLYAKARNDLILQNYFKDKGTFGE